MKVAPLSLCNCLPLCAHLPFHRSLTEFKTYSAVICRLRDPFAVQMGNVALPCCISLNPNTRYSECKGQKSFP